MHNDFQNMATNKQVLKKVIAIFFLFFILKSILAYFVTAPFSPDVYLHTKMSKSFFESGTFIINGLPSHLYPPLYSIVISVSYLFKDYNYIYFSMQIINAFLTSLVIVPAFLISRNFMDDKKSIILSSIISFLPLNFYYPVGYILSENLFGFLLLFMIYFLHKSLIENSQKWQLVAGFLLGLCILTRYIAFSIFPAVVFTLLIREIYYSDFKSIKIILNNFSKSIFHHLPFFTIAFVTFLLWIIRNGLIFGFTTGGLMGGYSSEISCVEESVSIGIPFFSRLFMEFFAHVGALVYASGIIFFATSLFLISDIIKTKQCEKTLSDFIILSFSITLMAVLLASYHNGLLVGLSYIRIQPRYIEVALPLIYITGYLGLMKYQQKIQKIPSLNLTSYFLISFIFMIFLLPVSYVSSISLSHSTLQALDRLYYLDMLLGTSDSYSFISSHVALTKLSVFIGLIFGWLLLDNKRLLTLRYVTVLIVLMLLVTNTVGIAGRVLYSNEFSTEIGSWYNSHPPENPGIVLFDERDVDLHYIGLWISAPIRVGNVTSQRENVDFIVSSDTLNLQVVTTEKTHNKFFLNGTEIPEKVIYLYKV